MLKLIKPPAFSNATIAALASEHAVATTELKQAEREHPIAGQAVRDAEGKATRAAVAAGRVVTSKELSSARDAAHIALSKALLRVEAAKVRQKETHAALSAAIAEYLDDPATIDLCIHEWVHLREQALDQAAALAATLSSLAGVEATYVEARGEGSASFADQQTIAEIRFRLGRLEDAIYAAPAANRGIVEALRSA